MTNHVQFDFTGRPHWSPVVRAVSAMRRRRLFATAERVYDHRHAKESPDDYDDVDLSGMEYRQLSLTDRRRHQLRLPTRSPELDILINNAGANFPEGSTSPRRQDSPARSKSTYSPRSS